MNLSMESWRNGLLLWVGDYVYIIFYLVYIIMVKNINSSDYNDVYNIK